MVEIIKVSNELKVIEKLCHHIQNIANDSIKAKSVFRIGLSGGSLTKYLSTGLPNIQTDWTKWELYFCDERYVPEYDSDSTFGVYKTTLLPKTNLKETQFYKINEKLELNECAVEYESRIRKAFGLEGSLEIPVFDLLLLGMGPDGHTCSLFPSHKLLEESSKLVAPIDCSPKPPPKRITMTYPLINNASFLIFAMAGSGKADMVKRVLVDHEKLPAGLVQPINGQLIWILDNEAAFYL